MELLSLRSYVLPHVLPVRCVEPSRTRKAMTSQQVPEHHPRGQLLLGLAGTAVVAARAKRPRCMRRSTASAAAETPGLELDALKRELLRLCAAGNRGLCAGRSERARVQELAEKIEEKFQPPEEPAWRNQALKGSWAVIFTTSPDLTSLDRLPLPGWRTGRIGQVFEEDEEARNEIDFWSPFGSKVSQTVRCAWALRRQPAAFGVELSFVGSSTQLSEVAGLQVPVPAVSLPLPPAAGIFQVSFVDEELLIQRTRAGSDGINILVKES
eukprot:TRINITY_DN60737_c0_g1_i1.p1 TRINITY_DN60737_c0_g1~~TRINITY_DN60737_c0_g1_i1.p1  ORF type:complete len:284 (-),score=65.65 TRINITY_DN60737_c0_g1_i1:6-809(-)